MNLATPATGSPTFFGRVPLLLNAELRFAAALDSLRELCSALEVGAGALPEQLHPARLIDELGRVITRHFEDVEDCLKMVAAHRPDLLPAVVDVRADHAALSRTLADLRLLVADEARWTELPLRVGRLLAKVELHRDAEAALIRNAAAPDANVA